MLTLTLVSWLTLAAVLSILTATELSKTLSYACYTIVLNILLLFALDLDLLASALLAIYSSVFLFLTLLSLVQNSYEAATVSNPQQHIKLFALLLVFVLTTYLTLKLTANPAQPTSIDYFSLLWFDVYSFAQDFIYSAAVGLHFMFYKIFIGETIMFNLYLLLGLMAAVFVLNFLRKQKTKTHSNLKLNKASKFLNTAPTLTSVKSVYSFRRQVRRKNNSNSRFTL